LTTIKKLLLINTLILKKISQAISQKLLVLNKKNQGIQINAHRSFQQGIKKRICHQDKSNYFILAHLTVILLNSN